MNINLPVECEVKDKTKVILSQEIAKVMNINNKTQLSLEICENEILIKKRIANCIFCNTIENLTYFKGKYVCFDCIRNIKKSEKGKAIY